MHLGVRTAVAAVLFAASTLVTTSPVAAQPLQKSAVQVDAGSTKQTGQTFGYRLTYNCSNTSGPCLNAQVVDLLPASVTFDSTVPASPTGDVAAINVTNNFGGSGRTRVQFVMNSPLTAGNSGDLLINVHFPNGSTPDGTVATNTADGINLGATPGTFTTPPVNVTAKATVQTSLAKTLQTSPANLDMPESYRLRISVPNNPGALNLTAIGPVVDTLPTGTVFNGATPAADCQPGCVGTTPATVTWTSPCSVPLTPGGNCDIAVNVTFPSATFTSGTNVTNSFTAAATPLGQPSQNLGVGQVTHPVTTFVPAPNAGLSKGIAGGSPNPPTLNQTFSYDINVNNSGNVPLDTMVFTDTLPIQMQVASVTTGSYNNASDFAAGVGVRVSYEKNTAPGVFTLWGSSPSSTTNTTLTAPPPGLGAGEYITRVRWQLGATPVGFSANAHPNVTGQIINPDHAGAPVAFGATIQNCVDLTAVYTAGPTNVTKNTCPSFTLSGPFVQLNPAKDNLSGGGPFNSGQTVNWRLHVRSAAQSSDPAPLQGIVASDLLPVDLVFVSWTFDDQGTGLPAPQTFEQIPNFNGTGRTLLRWRWNAGSGNLGVNQQVLINFSTTIRSGAQFGSLSNTFDLTSNNPGLAQRCNGSSTTDAQDLDGDGSTADTLCTATGTANVAPIAQLVSNKQVKAVCDADYTSTSAGTLVGGNLEYRLRVQNVGTVPMQNTVIIDILPFVGDTGVRDTNPRGSQWTPLLAAPINPPAGTVLYYSTSGNPCRPEVGVNVPGCEAPNWTTVPPTPITAVRSFKVEFGSRVIGAFDTLQFTFHLTAPGNVPAGAIAYNSFAYQADRADGLGSLAAEPQKVGVGEGTCDAASLGDFVWVDTNKDGTQNDGPTGLNNVYVRLFSPGPDGVPGTLDDVPLASAVTGPGPDSAPGWYNFPGLAPGSYFVCATPPATFIFTNPGLSTPDKDSDANTTTGCSPVVTLVANQHDPDVDFGLIATQLAALGDYVWIDRNSDGIQNESPWDGVNGVAVKLYVDNGNGTADPATDALVATTITADDVYGRPGYYRFDGLIPGLNYFVRFVKPGTAGAFTSQHSGGDTAADSDADTATGITQMVVLAPGEYNSTIDAGLVVASGTLALGDQVWKDTNNNGLFEPQNGELGIDGVRLDLYLDANGDGLPTLDEQVGTTFTDTVSGFAGRYRFSNLAPGSYIVVVDPSSFGGGGALSGLASSTGNDPAPDPDDDVNGDDNGRPVGALIGTLPVTLTANGEPTSEDGDANTNLTVDFGFIAAGAAPQPRYDYGDAPNVAAGTGTGNYNTTVLNNGAYHLLGVPNAPYLGSCVDADSGFNQNGLANADDITGSAFVVGTCVNGKDEDGVTFAGPFTPGATATFNVTSGGPTSCVLNAWVDWNRDGVFGNSPGEQIATDLTVPSGPATALNPTVPAGAIPGLTYARFRCSSATGLGPTGPAPDGEVEDYVVSVVGFDYGDAPASYGTQGAGAARHRIDFAAPPLMLGHCVDTETDGQPNATATGDDTAASTSRIGTCFSDEDGVTFTSPITACTTATVAVFMTGTGGKLDAWLDFDRNGDFAGTGEQIFTGTTLVAGVNSLTFAVPCTAQQGVSYARFRLSTAGGLGSAGDAPDGEVEDYAIELGSVDFGDAPDSYGTTLGAGGPFHKVVPGFSLGATEDSEAQGQPSVGADGDGADEDGVTIPAGGFVACSTVNVPVSLTDTAGIATPKLDAWIDFDGDGVFNDPRDRIATGLALVSGANTVTVNVPCDAKSKASYARFRLSATGVAGPGGAATDGEVEDYAVNVLGLDFGDAPAPYPTLLASNGARHAVLPVGNPTLGSFVDTEADGQPSANADGDDTHGTPDDEDGVVFPATLIPGTATGTIQLRSGGTGGFVSCWIDFNRNGSWSDAGDQVVTDFALAANTTTSRTFTVPVGSPQGNAPVRCRISSQTGLGVTGLAPDGEVEDHLAPIGTEAPKIGIAKRIISIDRDQADPHLFIVTFGIRLENMGNVPLSDVNASDNLDVTFPTPVTYTVTAVTSADFTVNNLYNGSGIADLLATGNTLAVGASGEIQVVVHVVSDNVGPYTNTAMGRGTSPANVPVTDVSQDGSDPDPDHDGDPTNNGTPTVFRLPFSIQEVPTLGTWGLMALALCLGLFAVAQLRRRREDGQRAR